VRESRPLCSRTFPFMSVGGFAPTLRPLRDFAIYIVRRRLCPRKRERAMTAPHICVGSADGDTETSAPDV
jgi:hypothetical protein